MESDQSSKWCTEMGRNEGVSTATACRPYATLFGTKFKVFVVVSRSTELVGVRLQYVTCVLSVLSDEMLMWQGHVAKSGRKSEARAYGEMRERSDLAQGHCELLLIGASMRKCRNPAPMASDSLGGRGTKVEDLARP